MKIQNGQRIVFIGDSVTDMGRSRNGDAPSSRWAKGIPMSSPAC